MSEPRITACVIAYNEEKAIKRCLDSIHDVVDEILLIHDGECKDKTLDIAKTYKKVKVLVRDHIGEAEYHRPYSFDKANGDWILQIDADEFLNEISKSSLRELTEDKRYDAYAFLWPVWIHHKEKYINCGAYSKMRKLCLFRKSEIQMIGITHTHPWIKDKKRIKKVDLHLEHIPANYGYALKDINTKIKNWSKIQVEQMYNLKSAPTYGINDIRSVLKKYEYQINYPVLSFIKEMIFRLGWFIINNKLSLCPYSYKFFLYDNSYIVFKYYYLILKRFKK